MSNNNKAHLVDISDVRYKNMSNIERVELRNKFKDILLYTRYVGNMRSMGKTVGACCTNCNSVRLYKCVQIVSDELNYMTNMHGDEHDEYYYCRDCGAFRPWKQRKRFSLKRGYLQRNLDAELYPEHPARESLDMSLYRYGQLMKPIVYGKIKDLQYSNTWDITGNLEFNYIDNFDIVNTFSAELKRLNID